MFARYDAVSALGRASALSVAAFRPVRWLLSIIAPAILQVGLFTATSVAGEKADTEIDAFISTFDCMLVEDLKTISERGDKGKSRNRFFVVDMRDAPQRFVQCIFVEFDTKLLCEASSGRYGPPPSDNDSLVLSPDNEAALKSLGFDPPYKIANFRQEIALGQPPDFREVAGLLLRTMYVVYGARIDTPMSITAPMVGQDHVRLSSCLPLS
jgi:hypothetical protein